MIHIQAGPRTDIQQFTDWKRSNMRWIPELFERVLILPPPGVFTDNEILNGYCSVRTAYTSHLPDYLTRMLYMMERESANHDIKRILRKRYALGIASQEIHTINFTFLFFPSSDFEWGFREIDSNERITDGGES